MFRCNSCRKVVSKGIACKKVVVVSRVRHYPERKADPRNGIVIHRPIAFFDEKGKKKYHYPSDPGGVGSEIVVEANCCPKCASDHERKLAEASGLVTENAR